MPNDDESTPQYVQRPQVIVASLSGSQISLRSHAIFFFCNNSTNLDLASDFHIWILFFPNFGLIIVNDSKTERLPVISIKWDPRGHSCTMTHSYQFIVQNWIIERLQNDVINVVRECNVLWWWYLGTSGMSHSFDPATQIPKSTLKILQQHCGVIPTFWINSISNANGKLCRCLFAKRESFPLGEQKLDPTYNLRPNTFSMHRHGKRISSKPVFTKMYF